MPPYINSVQRPDAYKSPIDAGELNYKITRVVQEYLDLVGRSYKGYNEVIGVLECAKLELYRRQIAGYEDTKCNLNGDVYRGKE